jgi:hypothetical protein
MTWSPWHWSEPVPPHPIPVAAVQPPSCVHCRQPVCAPVDPDAPLPAGGRWSFMPAGLAKALEGLR